MPTPRINKSEQNAPYFITITVIEWLNIFTSKEYFDCLINCLKYCQKNLGLSLYEYVIMTNHIHLVAQAKEGYELSKIISSFKSFTSKEVLKLLKKDNRKHILVILRGLVYGSDMEVGANSFKAVGSDFHVGTRKRGYDKFTLDNFRGTIWQRENYPELIETDKFLQQKVDYVYNNPVVKGYVDEPQHYLYSSARNRYLDDDSIIKLDNDIYE